jgi:hypothetical protein
MPGAFVVSRCCGVTITLLMLLTHELLGDLLTDAFTQRAAFVAGTLEQATRLLLETGSL